jgi:uncharacterized membrane protein
MTPLWTWLAVVATIAVIVLYEMLLLVLQRRRPERLARSAHARLREDWFLAVSTQKGSEVLAVQTIRNSLMSATVLASTAALALMGTVTLAAPSLHTLEATTAFRTISPRLVLEIVLLSLLFASLVSTLMAVRFYNHAGFVGGMPVESEARKRWGHAAVTYLRKAGVLYGIGLRQLVLVVPVVAAILSPAIGPFAGIVVISVLFTFDRFSADSAMLNRPPISGD